MRRSALLLSTLALAAAVAGCSAGSLGPDLALSPTQQFNVEVRQEQDRIQLAARANALSPNQVDALAALAGRWREAGGTPVVIEAPAGAQNAAAGFQTASAAARVLNDYGVPPGSVVSTSYDATGRPDAAVQVSFVRHQAVIPNCAAYQSDYTATYENRPISGFGCAITANMAVQSSPGDLLAQREMTPADAARRGVVLDGYRTGKSTGTPRSSNPKEQATTAEAQR